mmetsp:Transcript_14161/g.41921  ORF Transcript_14161/g.41921 Transcript_14161/m.41921 type:complete len:287 (-) Transcript_14161:1583-2443(-)
MVARRQARLAPRLERDAEGEVVPHEAHRRGAVVDRPAVAVEEAQLKAGHAVRLNPLGRRLYPLHAVLDGDLLVLNLVKGVDARVAAEVQVGTDGVANVLALEVDHDVVQLPVKGERHLLDRDERVVLVQVHKGDRHARVGVSGAQLLHLCVEGDVEQRLAVRVRHVPRQQQLRQLRHSPRPGHLDVQPFRALVRRARVGDGHRPRAIGREGLGGHVLVARLEEEQLQHPRRRRRRRRRRAAAAGRRGGWRLEGERHRDLDVIDAVRATRLTHPEGDDDAVTRAMRR